MRNLSPPIQSALANTAQNVVWICSIEWPDGAAWYSTRDAALADRAVSNCMSGPGTLEMEASRVIGPRRSAPRSRLRVSLRLEGLPAPAVRERMERWEPEGLELRWGVLFLEPDRTPESADVVWLFAGFIERCVLTRTELQLECLDWVEIRGRKRFGRERDARSLPEGAAAVGRMVPWLFGAPGPVELLPWRVGPRRRAARTILPADTAIPVDSVEGLPERGVVQIGDERIVYESLDAVARTLGSASLPLARPEAAFHPEGTALVLMPAQGFEWVVAEHPCQAVERILADGLDLHPGDWSPATEDLDGESVQKVVFARHPCAVVYGARLVPLLLNGAFDPGAWAVESATTAEHPQHAADASATTFAILSAPGGRVLSLRWSLNLAQGKRRYGPLRSMALTARLRFEGPWEASTTLRMRFRKGALDRFVLVPRPPEARSGDLVEARLDLTDLLDGNGEWSPLDAPDGAGFLLDLELNSTGDPTLFRVYDVAVDLEYAPRVSVQMAERLTAVARGYASGGTLLENPADLLRFFLTDARGLGLDPGLLDEASFSSAASQLQARGYVFSNRLSEPTPLGAIVSRLLHEARCLLVMDGARLALRFEPDPDHWVESDFEVDGLVLLRGDDLRIERMPERELLRSVQLHYGRDFGGGTALSWRRALWTETFPPPPSHSAAGNAFVDRLHWHNHGDASVARDLARRLLGLQVFRRQRCRATAPLCALALLPGDRVSLRDAHFPLDIDQGWVEAVSVSEGRLVLLDLSFDLPGGICWRHDAWTFLRHRAGNRLLEFWIEGRLVAEARWDGLWRLRGRLVESATLEGELPAPIHFNPEQDRLLFGTGTDGSFIPRFALDREGRLLVAGGVAEDFPRADIVPQTCVDSNPERFAKSLADATPIFVFDVAANRLELRGRLEEESRFA